MQVRLGVLVALALAAAAVGPAAALPHRRQADPVVQPRRGPPEKTFSLGTIWVLQSVNGKPVTGDAPSFKIDTALRGSGFGGCNGFSMTLYPVKDQKLASGGIALTRKVCDPATMALEHTMLVTLHSLPTWDQSVDGTLSLKSGGATLLFRNGI